MPNILKKLNSFTAMRVKYGSYAVIASGSGGNTFPFTIDYLVIAGGGGGASGGGGGGAGGLRSSVTVSGGGASAQSPITCSATTVYTLNVGAGGLGYNFGPNDGRRGTSSVFGSVSTTGGGGGMHPNGSVNVQVSGGSTGGSQHNLNASSYGSPVAGEGYGSANTSGSYPANYPGNGGGGAGGQGADHGSSSSGGTGGVGVSINITGSSVFYAGGGGGSGRDNALGALGGNGGGGRGASVPVANGYYAGANGTNGLGGGAGSGTGAGTLDKGGDGGDGVVILKIPNTHTPVFSAGVVGTTPSLAVAGFKVYTITAAGLSDTVTF